METLTLSSKRCVGRYPGTTPQPKHSIERAERDALWAKEKHVLIVDDDPFFRRLFRLMLGQTGWPLAAIWEAGDSTHALELCRTEPVDLVFCDLNLANLHNLANFHSKSGLQVIRELRLIFPQIPIFMVTAENNEALIRLERAAGATGHLLKPINLRTLKSIL
jgi:CheY-like chemotaxis protein